MNSQHDLSHGRLQGGWHSCTGGTVQRTPRGHHCRDWHQRLGPPVFPSAEGNFWSALWQVNTSQDELDKMLGTEVLGFSLLFWG